MWDDATRTNLREELKPRLYQETIFTTATRKNTLVVLPTGTGKTRIAELLTLHRLHHYPGSKVLLLAPTKPLAEQHAQTFRSDLSLTPSQVVTFTGNVSPAKRAAAWNDALLVCSTPQSIENDLIAGRITLRDVSLLIVDEAHRATGEYSYVFIAAQYVKQAQHSRILALTASPGSEKETIEEVCRNLHIETIEARSRDSPDVAPYIQEVEIAYVRVTMPPAFKRVHTELQRCHDARKEELLALGVLNRQALVNKMTMLKAQGALHARAARGEKSYEHLKSMSLLAEALKIQHALELIETQGAVALKKYFEKLEREARQGQSKAVQNLVRDPHYKRARLLLDTVLAANLEHPKLRALQKEVLKHTYRRPDAKIIIFNQYRDQAVQIKQALDEIRVPAQIFVGQAKKGETGMSQKEQQALLKAFKKGEFPCLIATSVAEEGLDIPKVDVVLFYEPIPSAIRTVQRRGRTGRLERGKVIMLVTEGTRDVSYQWAAHHKEKRMYRLLKEVQRDLEQREDEPVRAQKREAGEKPLIIADHREKSGHVLKALIDRGVKIDLQQLERGDYQIGERVIIEYKRVPDFVNSIIDGRLLHQLRALRTARRPLLIIEGEEDLYSIRKVHPNAILGMLATITINYNIPVLFTRTADETAALLQSIARREGGPTERQPGRVEKPLLPGEQQRYVIASLPGIGPAHARALLTHFTTIKALANATREELEAVEGIGKKRAATLHDFFNKEYRE